MGEPILFSQTPHFLEVLIDPELNWKAHFIYMKNKITPRINILKTISGIRWGAHLKFFLIVYKGYIRSLFEWGCQVFHPVDNKL